MDEEMLRKRITELVEALREPPRLEGPGASCGTYVSQAPAASGSAEELLDHVSLHVKYLLFDLEATRRENRYLREILERRSNHGNDPDIV